MTGQVYELAQSDERLSSTHFFYIMSFPALFLLRKHFLILILIGVFLSFLMFITSSLVVRFWLNNNDEEITLRVIKVVKLMSLIPFLIAVISSFGLNGLLIYFKDKIFSFINVTSLLVLVLTSFYLIPNHGAMGAGLSLLISRILYALLSFLLFKNIVGKNE